MSPSSSVLLTWAALVCASLLARCQAQCPPEMPPVCDCATTRYEPVSIVCDRAASFADVIAALNAVPSSTPIDSLVISNTPIEKMPAFAFGRLHVKRLVLRNNGLVSIHPQAFDGGRLADTLTELEIRNNQLGEIPQSGLPTLRALRSLVLSKNGINALPPNAFLQYQSRTGLRRLDLSDNRFASVPAGFFNGLDRLQEVSLDKNFLRRVPTEALRTLSQLEDLSLGVNRLVEIERGALAFPNLKSLSLEVNQLSYIPPEAFQGVPNLLYLYLSNNKFTDIDPQMFFYISSLKVLAMGNNEQLTSIAENSFRYVSGLVRLEMAECSISNISETAFRNIPNAQVVVLSRNKISSVKRTVFQGMNQLVSLDLKGNEISEVQDGSFSNLPSLKHLDLSSNRINGFQPETFTGSLLQTRPATTRVLYLYENLFVCDNNLDWFRSYLRQNSDLVIDAPGYEPTRCWKPTQLYGFELRKPNPVQLDLLGATPKPKIEDITTTPSYTRATLGGEVISTQKKEENKDFLANTSTTSSRLSGMNLAAVILGIILGIFLISLILLMIVRYFAGKNRRQRKRDDDEARQFGSSLSGYPTATSSSYGTAYPAMTGPPQPDMGVTGLHHHQGIYGSGAYGSDSLTYRTSQHQQRPPSASYFLQRPWYWWF